LVVLGRSVDGDDVEVDVDQVVVEHDREGRDPEVIGDEERDDGSARSRQLRDARDHGFDGSGSRVDTKIHVGYLVGVPGGERARHRHADHIGIRERRSAGRLGLGPMSREAFECGREGEVHTRTLPGVGGVGLRDLTTDDQRQLGWSPPCEGCSSGSA
jgi:hypothetical protein